MKFFVLIIILSFGVISQGQQVYDSNSHILIQLGLINNLTDINMFVPKLEERLQVYGYDVSQYVKNSDTYISIVIEHSLSSTSDQMQYNFVLTIIGESEAISAISPVLFSRFNPTMWADAGITSSPESALNTLTMLIHFTARYLASDCEIIFDLYPEFNLEDVDEFTASYLSFIAGNCSLIRRDFDSAVELFNNSLEFDFKPDFSSSAIATTTNLAWVYVQKEENQTAIELMNSLVDDIEGFPYLQQLALQKRAQIYALIFDYTSAIQDMDSAIELIEYAEYLAEAYKQRGDIIMLIYEWNRALEDYNTAIELDPDYAEAYYRRGILLYTMVEREDAVTDFETYLEIVPDGQFADSASEYIENIQGELDALGG